MIVDHLAMATQGGMEFEQLATGSRPRADQVLVGLRDMFVGEAPLGVALREGHDVAVRFPGEGSVGAMPKYLWKVSYTEAGSKGLLDDGGTTRRKVITEMVESMGGHVEACYYALGATDLFVIGDVPDEVAAVTLSLRTAAAGGARSQTDPLLTPEQLDEATRRQAAYHPPGAD